MLRRLKYCEALSKKLSLGFSSGIVALTLGATLLAQPEGALAPAKKSAAEKKTEDKQTQQHLRGERLLRSAEAESAGLQPDMRAFILWKVAETYSKSNPAKSDVLLREAFLASLSIEDIAPEVEGSGCEQMVGCGVKTWLQQSTLQSMSSLTEAEQLLQQAQSEVQTQIKTKLISSYIAKKNLDRARQLIDSLGDQGDYPYQSATNLMMALPSKPGSDLEKVAIFSAAMNAYGRQSEAHSSSTAYEGFEGMVMRVYRNVPPAMAEDAIDQILARAKKADEGPQKMHLSFSGGAGTITLQSQYQYRLFQLLPILKQIDEAKAKSLVRDNPDLQPMLDRFPEGMQSVQPDLLLHPQKNGDTARASMVVSVGDGASPGLNAAALQAERDVKAKRQQIMVDVANNPRQAIAAALSLPECIPSVTGWGDGSCPRAETLLQIARALGKKNSPAAKEALGEFRNSLGSASLMTRARLLNDAAEQYVVLSDEDGADKTVKDALQVAEKLYIKDIDADGPNKAFKGVWPSTNEWRHCVQVEARFSPDAAEAIIAGIRDPEIAAVEKIYFARALLGMPSGEMVAAASVGDNYSWSTF